MTAFNKAFSEIAAKLLTVEKLDNPIQQMQRIGICQSNKCGFFDDKNRVCNNCGCYLDKKTPLFTNRNPQALGRIEVTHCPLGLWGKQDKMIANIYRLMDGKELIK